MVDKVDDKGSLLRDWLLLTQSMNAPLLNAVTHIAGARFAVSFEDRTSDLCPLIVVTAK